MSSTESFFTAFDQPIGDYELPQRFTFPYYYQPHPIALLAVKQLQSDLQKEQQWRYDYSLEREVKNTSGKMLGILVVENTDGELGYLSAFSGKMTKNSNVVNFVPQVCDVFEQDSYFLHQQKIINSINAEICQLELNPLLNQLVDEINQLNLVHEQKIADHRVLMIAGRKSRKQRRQQAQETVDETMFKQLNEQLGRESINDKNILKQLKLAQEQRVNPLGKQLNTLQTEIITLKNNRKSLSNALQQWLFSQYNFLNTRGEEKCLTELFKDTLQKVPPAGAGDCAAPKLLQYAFKNQMKPIALAEFWWGSAPKSEIRQHLNFYGACLGKCQPILTHMLADMPMDENPLLANPAAGKDIQVIYHDDAIAIINKPAEFLSVPGKNISDSVYSRMKTQFPQAEGSLIVHRLDMSTSGLMVIALNKKAHKLLQRQFIDRSIKKKYIALITGHISQQAGIINLPLRGDINDRPRQLVCHNSGKPAQTKWQVIEYNDSKENPWTKVALYPKTGRTHQLRVHCAHPLGLNSPIIGDDLYGIRAERLYLHAQSLSLVHPISKAPMDFSCETEF